MRKSTIVLVAMTTAFGLWSGQILAESPYPTPTRDGRQRIYRAGSCPTGYVGKGNFCEALHKDTPDAMPRIKGAACPYGYFASGDACKAFQ